MRWTLEKVRRKREHSGERGGKGARPGAFFQGAAFIVLEGGSGREDKRFKAGRGESAARLRGSAGSARGPGLSGRGAARRGRATGGAVRGAAPERAGPGEERAGPARRRYPRRWRPPRSPGPDHGDRQ